MEGGVAIYVFFVLFATATFGQNPPQQIQVTDGLQSQASQATADQAVVSSLLEPAQIACDQAVTQVSIVDPNATDTVVDAMLSLAVANQTLQFLADASSAATNALTIARNADPDDAAATAFAQTALDQASYSLLMASNNLGLLSEDVADEDVPNVAADAIDPEEALADPKKPKTVKGPDGPTFRLFQMALPARLLPPGRV